LETVYSTYKNVSKCKEMYGTARKCTEKVGIDDSNAGERGFHVMLQTHVLHNRRFPYLEGRSHRLDFACMHLSKNLQFSREGVNAKDDQDRRLHPVSTMRWNSPCCLDFTRRKNCGDKVQWIS